MLGRRQVVDRPNRPQPTPTDDRSNPNAPACLCHPRRDPPPMPTWRSRPGRPACGPAPPAAWLAPRSPAASQGEWPAGTASSFPQVPSCTFWGSSACTAISHLQLRSACDLSTPAHPFSAPPPSPPAPLQRPAEGAAAPTTCPAPWAPPTCCWTATPSTSGALTTPTPTTTTTAAPMTTMTTTIAPTRPRPGPAGSQARSHASGRAG